MKQQEFVDGLKDGMAGLLAVTITLSGIILLLVLIIGLQLWIGCTWIAGYKRQSYNALNVGKVNPSLCMVTDTYLYWYEKLTSKFND